MNFKVEDFAGMKITVMGLGLHGGGTASARFFAEKGADVTVTDLRDSNTLLPSIKSLQDLPIRYILGKHEKNDFSNADIVIKNPAVSNDSPFIKLAKTVETDISIFLALNNKPIIAVTGSKGKSTTVSAIYHTLKSKYPDTYLGGNITVSPLTFFDKTNKLQHANIILELSSWQLADLNGKNILKPAISIITNILPDHQDRYKNIEKYAEDKALIFSSQDTQDFTICNFNDPYGKIFAKKTPARAVFFSYNKPFKDFEGAWLDKTGGFYSDSSGTTKILPETLLIPGEHNRINLLCAGLALLFFGLEPDAILTGLGKFNGIEHRLEFVRIKNGIRFINDSAATIPEAAVAAVNSFNCPVYLITGGTDKKLNFNCYKNIARIPKKIYILKGNASDKIITVIKKAGGIFKGPYESLKEAVIQADTDAAPGSVILFSPGCASFEMFLNEFDRGRVFKNLVMFLNN